MKNYLHFIAFAGMFILGSLSYGASIYKQTTLFRAGAEAHSLQEVIKSGNEFRPLAGPNEHLGFTSEHVWLRFELSNPSSTPVIKYLETARPITDYAELYRLHNGDTAIQYSGDQVDFEQRPVKHRTTLFKVELPAQSTVTFYLHLKSDGETINVPLELYDADAFIEKATLQQLFVGGFYGLILLASIIYLFFFLSMRDKSFLYYGLYVLAIGGLQLALDGLIFQYVFPTGGFINSKAVLVTALLSNFFLLKYTSSYLTIQERLRGLGKLFKVFYVLIAVMLVATLAHPSLMEYVYPISNVNGLFSLIAILSAIGLLIARKEAPDWFFNSGMIFLLIGLLAFVLNNLGIVPNNFFTLNSAKIGVGLEVIFLSLAMTNRIRFLRLEKEQNQALALEKSEEVNQLKSYFMSNMSHELRTPINAITGIVDDLLSKKNTTEDREQFEIIKYASVGLLSSVNDILDFEKIEKGTLELRSDSFNPSISLNQIIASWKAQASEKGLAFSYTMDPEIPASALGDGERFIQIINNVLSNAVKFTLQGSISVNLKCVERSKDETLFSFVIKDTGVESLQTN